MLKKILLACCSKKEAEITGQLVCRANVTVGERTTSDGLVLRGYFVDNIGAIQIVEQSVEWVVLGVFTQNQDGQLLCCIEVSEAFSADVMLVNETNGVSCNVSIHGMNQGYQYIGAIDIFEGIAAGQTCSIAMYIDSEA